MDLRSRAPHAERAGFFSRRTGSVASGGGAEGTAWPASDGTRADGSLGWLRLGRSLGEIAELAHRNPTVTSYMRYRAEQAGRAPDPGLIQWVPLGDISPYLVCAVVGAEDPAFCRHGGIWWEGLRTSIGKAIRERKGVRGVSTITQQLARNLYLRPDRSMRRKVQEALVARQLERVLTKERILELYLNVAEWGEGIWGVGMAAREHFSRPAAELDAFQAVVLSSMLPAPRRPLRDQNARRAAGYQKAALRALYGSGAISRDEGNQVHARILELERAVAEGVPAPDVLRRSTGRPIQPTPRDGPAISVRSLVADHFGVERARAFRRFEEAAARERRAPKMPLWWTGEPERELLAGAPRREER
jgi:monofunctional biosynthetic peptidoglycan transglycosylase